MKSSTYASLVTIVFLRNQNARSRSIQGVIRTTDTLCRRLGHHNTLSRMTKYRIISDLISSKIVTARKTRKSIKLTLSAPIQAFL